MMLLNVPALVMVVMVVGPSLSSLSSSAVATAAAAATETENCGDPDRSRLEELWQSGLGWTHDSLFQVAGLETLVTPAANVSRSLVHVRRLPLQPQRCPFPSRTPSQLQRYRRHRGANATLCPSHDVLNHDPNRVPATLYEKRCSCSACGVERALEAAVREQEKIPGGFRLQCRPLTFQARVLRRVGCRQGVFVYRAVLEPLVLGCGCQGKAFRVH